MVVEFASALMWAIGFVLGLEHSLDADHVVAVSTILSNCRNLRRSLILALSWGLGHTITLFFAGLFVLALRIMIPESVGRLFEFAVGIMLILLGISVVKALIADKIHLHRHAHGEYTHAHFHSHSATESHNHAHKSLFAGVLQGMAGSAALMLLTLSTVNSVTLGLIYILIFGIGVILGMLIIGGLIGSLLIFAAVHLNKIHEMIRAITGLASICLGTFIIIEIGLTGVLF